MIKILNLKGKVSDYIGDNFDIDNSTFIGRVGCDIRDNNTQLYLFTYSSAVSLQNPSRTWDGDVPVEIDKFEDLEVTIK